MIFSSRHPFRVRDMCHSPAIDSSRINNAPITNQSAIFISTVNISLQVYSSADTNKAIAWWNGAQSLGRHVLLLSATSSLQRRSFNSVRARGMRATGPKSVVAALICMIKVTLRFSVYHHLICMMTLKRNDEDRCGDQKEKGINVLMTTMILMEKTRIIKGREMSLWL